MGFLARLFGRRGGSDAPAPTRDDTLSSTYVPPPTPDVQPQEPGEEHAAEAGDEDTGDAGDGGGGNGGGGDD